MEKPDMNKATGPAKSRTGRPESLEERAARLEQQRVGPEDEVRKSSGGPETQVSPDIEPAGS
jgi:hypothetical protein